MVSEEMDMDREIIEQFVIEANEHLENIEQQLLEVESQGANADTELLNTIFRGIHSIKGTAGFLGFESINNLAHSLENVLNLLREKTLTADSELIDVLLRSSDVLCRLIADVDQSDSIDVSKQVAELDSIHAAALNKPDAGLQPESPKTCPANEPGGVDDPQSRPPETRSNPADSTIRVPVEMLDHLMNLAGELVVSRNELLQTVPAIENQDVKHVVGRVDQVTAEIQDAVMQTRLQPIGTVFDKFTRVVRDLSKALGKSCRLEIEGRDVEVDKSIIEAISDPLTHLIRNSIDHGIESPDVRKQRGKSETGTISLRAFHEAGNVKIEVSDDGGGIDPEKIRGKAVAQGILTEEESRELGRNELLEHVFHPGFSTAESVTEVSGRGVGMDVVRTNIEKMGGLIEIDSTPLQATTLTITLPLTLAIIPCMIVRCGEDNYAVPQINIAELVRLGADDVRERVVRIKSSPALKLRDELLPLVDLRQLFGVDGSISEHDYCDVNSRHCFQRGVQHVVVVDVGQKRYGLIVDGVVNSEEIVIKPLGEKLRGIPCYAGATILGNGRVALIADVAGIASHVRLRFSLDSGTTDSVNNRQSVDNRNSLLLFNNHSDELFALPMNRILRLECVANNEVFQMGDKEFIRYQGKNVRVIRLEEHIQCQPPEETTGETNLALFQHQGTVYGLATPQLRDILDVEGPVDDATLREKGVAGLVSIDDVPTRLILPQELVDDSATESSPTVRPPKKRSRILLADDSNFFRRQVKDFLTTQGYEVVDATNGRDAWETLSEDDDFDLVITDIEMPEMNGFELCRSIKSSALAAIPVIALTSLCDDEFMRRCQQSGIDEYQIKLDRHDLLHSVRQWVLAGQSPDSNTGVPQAEVHSTDPEVLT